MATRIYLDANAIIGAVENDDDELAARVSEIVVSSSADCVSSELTLAEVLVGVLRSKGIDGTADQWLAASYDELFRESGPLEVVQVERSVLINAARIRAANLALKIPDAIHLSTALAAKCTVMLSGDRKLLKAAEGQGLTSCSLRISDLDSLLALLTPTP